MTRLAFGFTTNSFRTLLLQMQTASRCRSNDWIAPNDRDHKLADFSNVRHWTQYSTVILRTGQRAPKQAKEKKRRNQTESTNLDYMILFVLAAMSLLNSRWTPSIQQFSWLGMCFEKPLHHRCFRLSGLTHRCPFGSCCSDKNLQLFCQCKPGAGCILNCKLHPIDDGGKSVSLYLSMLGTIALQVCLLFH